MFVTVFSVFSINAFAASGKAIVSHWSYEGSTPNAIYVTNITDNDLAVSVTIYNKDGGVVNPTTVTNFQNSNTEVAAGKTGYVTVQSSNYGYAVIQWTNLGTDDDVYGLVAFAQRGNTTWHYAVPVNSGNPF